MECKNMLLRIERTPDKGIYRMMVHIPGVLGDGEWACTNLTVFQLQETGLMMCAEAGDYWDAQAEQLNAKLIPMPKVRMCKKLENELDDILGGNHAT